MDVMIEARGLSRRFGPIVAVDDVSFAVGRGEVLGFLGPNGAGKSTTMKMITGFLAPTSGTAVVCGADIRANPVEAKRHLGYLPEGAPAYPDMTPKGFLRFIASIRGFNGAEAKKRVALAVERLALANVLEQPIDTLSKGFKRRVGLAQALLHDPAGADPRRADRRPRSQPETRGARAHQRAGGGKGDRALDPSAGRGRRGLHPRHRHRVGKNPGRRDAALSSRRARAITTQCVSRSQA